MLRKKEILEKIIEFIKFYENIIKEKAKNNLLDENVLSEDFIKDLLNICCDWNLINLNKKSNFPGIDLGDIEKHIGVQVTSDKTSNKISETLDIIVRNHVEDKYNKIYFFILGKKQNRYSVKFDEYKTIECTEKNIWDISDFISWCRNYDIDKLEKILNIITRELTFTIKAPKISVEIKRSIMELREVVGGLLNIAKQLIINHCLVAYDFEKLNLISSSLEKLFLYLDDKTYSAVLQMLKEGVELENFLKNGEVNAFKVEAVCNSIVRKSILAKNLQQAAELINNDIHIKQNGMNAIIDGNDLFDRVNTLGVDKDIIYKQFSVKNFIKVIESLLFRRIGKCIVFLTTDNKNYNEKMICRLNSEGIQVMIFDNKTQMINTLGENIDAVSELLLISSDVYVVGAINRKKSETFYCHTVSFNKDLPKKLVPLFFSRCEIRRYDFNNCFDYVENRTCNINDITEQDLKEMIANASDNYSHQLRIDWDGDIYISTITGAENVNGVKCRWESWDEGNGYVGPCAASETSYVKYTLERLRKCWEQNIKGYCDYYNCL